MRRRIEYVVPPEYDGKPAKVFLRRGLGMSARTLTVLKNDPDGLTLNGAHVRTIDPLKTGDVLGVTLPEEQNAIAPSDPTSLEVVYEDDDVLVVNKPAGLAVHPTHNHQGDTLANMVAGHLLQKNDSGLFRAVGRLDKQTSGLVLLARNRHAASCLQGAYDKTYYAIAEGVLTGQGTIDTPIYRPDPGKTLRAAGETGETAVTHWIALKTDGEHTLLRVTLETGRTHQIRVHLSSVGHPLAGDEMYGGHTGRVSRAALHCGELVFLHPVTGEPVRLTAPFPADFFLLPG